MASFNKVFMHISAPCAGCKNISEMWDALETAAIPFAIYAANDAGLIANSTKYKHADLIYRDVEASTVNPADYSMGYDQAALKYWAKQMFALPESIKALRGRVWIELMNEPGKDGNQAQWVGAVSARMAKIAISEGYRVMSAGWSPGTPEPEHWLTDGWREYLTIAAGNPDRVAVSIHEYSLDNNIRNGEGWLVGRFRFLFDTCDQMGIKRPSVYITESGWTLNSMPDDKQAMKDIAFLAELYAGYPEIKAAFLWTLQAGKGNGDLPQRLNSLIQPLTDYTLQARFPDPAPVEPPEPPQPPQEPPTGQYKAVVVLLPPSTKPEQAAGVARYRHQMRQTITYSLDDMDRLMPPLNPQARPDSEVIAYNFVDWDEAGKARIRRHRYKAQAFGGRAQSEPEPPAGPVIGTDISKWQGAVNFVKMKAAGVQFCFIRCSYGTFEDERLYSYAPAALAAGLPYGFYAYYHPWQDPIEQANLVVSLVNKYGVDFPVAVDLEETKNIPSDYAARIKRCLDHLTAALGHKPIIYTSAGYWNGTLKSPSWGKDYDLWIAAWTSAASPAIPAPWSDWRFWQFTSSGVGADYGVSSARIDLNRWNGTAAQLAAYRIPRQSTPPATPATDMASYFFPASGNLSDIAILKNNWGANDERQQLQRDGELSYVTKNSQWERRRITAAGVFLEMDTSPGEGEYYTVKGQWLPRSWRPGDSFTRSETVSYFRKSDCKPVPSKPTYTKTSTIRFEALHSSWTSPAGVKLSDVIELVWIVDGVIEEQYYYGRGVGLVQWKNRHGRHSWIVERVPLGNQHNNQREKGCFG